ncbi:hypothetical protein SEPCBS119000_002734 [Sporothrix epigloea]|uniref:CFEM domain-containing protein n=1 Tax=Sporothrix epigloea TaxID=1892477 RepID=A0ABP0DL98_9PEZI
MKSLAIFALAGLAAAQFSQLPTCAQSCANKFLTGGIGNCGSDAKCICSDKDFLSDIACCLAAPGACDPADQSSAVGFASQLCAAQGVTGLPSVVSCTSTSFPSSGTAAAASTTGSAAAKETSSTATGSGTGKGTGSGTAATAASSTAAAATTSAATTSAAAATTATTSTGTGTAAAATTSSSTSNPAARESAGVAGLVGGVIAALAML